MAFYAGQLVRRPELENPTIVVMTDRNDLDDQLPVRSRVVETPRVGFSTSGELAVTPDARGVAVA